LYELGGGLDLWGVTSGSHGQWYEGASTGAWPEDWNAVRSLGFFGPGQPKRHVDLGSVSATDNEPRTDELAPITPAATRKELAPTGVPRTKVASAVLGRKSVNSSSNRYAVFGKDAIDVSPPWRKEIVEVPLAELIREPSKRQVRRIKEHMRSKSRKFEVCTI
jgi:hypothetical protein